MGDAVFSECETSIFFQHMVKSFGAKIARSIPLRKASLRQTTCKTLRDWGNKNKNGITFFPTRKTRSMTCDVTDGVGISGRAWHNSVWYTPVCVIYQGDMASD